MPKSIAMKQETRKLIFVGVAVAVLSTFANQGVDIIANTYDENTWDEELIQAEVKIKKRIEPLEQSVLDLAIGRRETKEERQREKRLRLEDDIGRNPEQWTAVERDLWETYNKAEKKARGERMNLEAARDAKEANLFVPPDPLQDE